VVAAIGSGLEALAKGNLTYRLNAEMTGTFAKLKDDFNAALAQLEDAMKAVQSGTEDIGVGANEISQAADDLSRRTEQQAASLEETAAALEQITATVKMTAQNAKEATSIVTKRRPRRKRAAEWSRPRSRPWARSSNPQNRSPTLSASSTRSPSRQTCLRSMRALKQRAPATPGKGFAVVASEVRALAQRSSQAAKEIKSLIQASGGHVASGVKYVGETGDSLRRIVEQVMQINALVSEMASAAHQQSTGIEEVNAAVTQMDQVTQQNAAMVEQSTAAARNLASETADLKGRVSFFSVSVEDGEETEDVAPVPAPKAVRRSGAAKPCYAQSWRDSGFGGIGGSVGTHRRRVAGILSRHIRSNQHAAWQEFLRGPMFTVTEGPGGKRQIILPANLDHTVAHDLKAALLECLSRGQDVDVHASEVSRLSYACHAGFGLCLFRRQGWKVGRNPAGCTIASIP
jgi:methyl-accepting chemotaxis protein